VCSHAVLQCSAVPRSPPGALALVRGTPRSYLQRRLRRLPDCQVAQADRVSLDRRVTAHGTHGSSGGHRRVRSPGVFHRVTHHLRALSVTHRALSVTQRALSVTQAALCVTQRAPSVTQRALSVTQRALSVTQRALSVTQRALSVTQRAQAHSPRDRL
jgi:hypothetical protein